MIGPPQTLAEARSCAELVDAFRARKEELSLSNEAVEHVLGLTSGHADKLWSGTRGLSADMLDKMLQGFGLKVLVAIDSEQVQRMRPRWENAGRRDQRQVRPPARIAASLIKRARPVVMREAGRRGGLNTWRKIPDSRLRSRLMSELAKLRWTAKRSASAPVAQQETAGPP
jgi:transcriptional regulator with XRE-family HTH domain